MDDLTRQEKGAKRTPSRFPWMGFIKSGDDLLSRCSHYHRPQVLNGRVRNGNGCGHLGMVTGKRVKSGEWIVKSEIPVWFFVIVTNPIPRLVFMYQMAAATRGLYKSLSLQANHDGISWGRGIRERRTVSREGFDFSFHYPLFTIHSPLA